VTPNSRKSGNGFTTTLTCLSINISTSPAAGLLRMPSFIRIVENSEISAGHPGYLGTLQREITRQWNDLTSEKRDEFQALANEWSSGIAPEAVKCRQVILSGMRSLHSSLDIQDGVLYAEVHHP